VAAPVPPGGAEHDTGDDLERDALHPGAEREGLAHRPGLDLGSNDVSHRVGQGAEPLPVERRRQPPAFAPPRLSFETKHRFRAHQRLQEILARGAGLADVAVGA
jgi:hypothetical protein